MSIKGSVNLSLGCGAIRQNGVEPHTAPFADCAQIRGCFHDAEPSFCHDLSLPPSREPVDFKRHHYPIFPLAGFSRTLCLAEESPSVVYSIMQDALDIPFDCNPKAKNKPF